MIRFCTICLLCAAVHAGGPDWSLNLDSFASYEREPQAGLGEAAFLGRLRLNMNGELGAGWSWEGAYELDGFYNENIGRVPTSLIDRGVFPRKDDLKRVIHRGNDALGIQNLDRLSVRWERGRGTLTLGRQAVGHGNGRFFTPSDMFAPLSGTTLNAQYKSGIDGVRYGQGFGDDGEWALMAFFPEEGKALVLAQIAGVIRQVDLSFLVGDSYGEPTLAWDIAGTWQGAALYSEGIWRKGDNRDDPLRAMLGYNRRFGTKWDVTVEVRLSNIETDSPFQLQLLPEVRRGEMVWLSQNHIGASLDVELTALMRFNAAVLWESDNESAWYQAGLFWDATERATFSCGLRTTSGGPLTEFGIYGDTAFAEYRLTLP
ncbi:MAG: hypothetical protein QNK37_39135 [Acidobacteriota bacterium]|nr:hypothetical protein [Acidobacteriota bacterium]